MTEQTKIIEHNGKQYRYDFNSLTIAQLRSAEAVIRLQFDRQEYNKKTLHPQSDDEAFYRERCASHLFTALENGLPCAYSSQKAREVFEMLKQCPMSIVPVVEEAIDHFFSHSESGQMYFMVRYGSIIKSILGKADILQSQVNSSISETSDTNPLNPGMSKSEQS
jgi:hypothetical protein